MTAVDIFKASRMQQIEDTTVVSGLVGPNGHLLLSTRVGEEIDAGNVIGPKGPGFTYRGPWAAATPYLVNDVVIANGSTFVVTAAHTSSSTAPTSTTPGANLALWAREGAKGDNGIQGSVAIPAGTISLWASDVAPANWMICDGSAVSRTQYPSLFASIGTKYGAGDGVNTFNLPDLKGRTPIGLDATQTEFNVLAKVGGAKTHKLTALQSGIRDHEHILPMGTVAGVGTTTDVPARASGTSGTIDQGFRTGRIADNSVASNGAGVYGNAALTTTAQTDAVDAHNILQPYSVVNFIIKVTAGDTPGDSELTQRISALEASYGTTPAGTISAWGGDIAPPNWLLCDGSAVSRTTYASLFAAIGIKFGAGNGTTTFNLPDLRGRMPVGRDVAQTEFDVTGETGGTKTHTHQHVSPIGSASGNSYVLNVTNAIMDSPGSYDFNRIANPTAFTGGALTPNSGAMEIYNVTSSASGTLPPYLTVNFIIKTTQGITPGDSQLAARVAQLEAQVSSSALQLRDRMRRAQHVITGGGTRKVSNAGFSWSTRFIVIGQGWEDPALAGYWDITMPPNGTSIPVYGSTTTTTSLVAAGEIPMNGWLALYYELPLDQSFASDPSRFRMISYTKKLDFIPPPNWVLICVRNTDAGHAAYKWGDGRSQDFWHPFTPSNGWVQFANYSPLGWKWKDDGSIQLRGLMSSGTQGTTVADWGAALAPEANCIFVGYSNTSTARLDMNTVGQLVVNGYSTGASNAWVSLENVNWFPKGS